MAKPDTRRARRKLARHIAKATEDAVRASQDQADGLAQSIAQRAPVDTGALRDSVVVEKTPQGANVIVGEGDEVDYARFVEDGTRYMGAQPYIGPAVTGLREELREAVENAVKNR